MNSVIAPKYIRKIKGFYVLWFDYCNKYIIVNKEVMSLLNLYLESSNESHFLRLLKKQNKYSQDKSKQFYIELTQLLEECSIKKINKPQENSKITLLQDKISVAYKINDFIIQINYSSENVKSLIHPQFENFVCKQSIPNNVVFDIYQEKNTLKLYKDLQFCGAYPLANYHLLQGQFAMELLCVLNNKKEKDWLGTFHASTVSNGKSAIMLVGDSGKGKSTLAALLMANGYKLVADDFTPMLAKNQKVYNYPAALSIKQGSFSILEPLFKDFNNLPSYFTNPTKGCIKYLEAINQNNQQNYICNKIVNVNYKKGAKTELSEVSIDKILRVLIPDSWLSPQSNNANYFLDWLEKVTFYELIYSDTKEVITTFQNLFKT